MMRPRTLEADPSEGFRISGGARKNPVNRPGFGIRGGKSYALAAGADSTICKPGTLIAVIFTWV